MKQKYWPKIVAIVFTFLAFIMPAAARTLVSSTRDPNYERSMLFITLFWDGVIIAIIAGFFIHRLISQAKKSGHHK